MYDVLYVGGTIVFFALMLAYVRACETLGHIESVESASSGRGRSDER